MYAEFRDRHQFECMICTLLSMAYNQGKWFEMTGKNDQGEFFDIVYNPDDKCWNINLFSDEEHEEEIDGGGAVEPYKNKWGDLKAQAIFFADLCGFSNPQ